ncbi:MAG TPA: efflux RND transporter periplasmic adaptor subunit [Hyphomicrobiales bacterium]|nr:efflux RND transporter periplasmic adaptor subunit [Hyphomicrobiales bacterium]
MGRWLRKVAPVAVLGVLPLVAACKDDNAYAPPPPPSVEIAQPLRQDVTRYLNLTGTATAVASVTLEARVEGTLQSIDYQDGHSVKKGQRLFLIDPAPYQAQVAQAEAAVDQAKATLANAQSQYDRQSQLGTNNVSSKSAVDQARAARDQAKAQVDSANAALKLAQLNLGYTTVAAPFDGVAMAHQADVGALVGHGSPTPLATVVKLDPIDVSFNLSETQLLEIRRDLQEQGKTLSGLGPIPVEAGTEIEKGYPHRGTLDYVAPQVDTASGTLALRAVFGNDGAALLPGYFMRVRIPLDVAKDALLVPARAVGTDQQGSYVMTVGADGTAHQQPVTLASGVSGYERVVGGLEAGDWVVVGGLDRAISGDKVAPQRITLKLAAAPLPSGG